jgi:hypothetical protein
LVSAVGCVLGQVHVLLVVWLRFWAQSNACCSCKDVPAAAVLCTFWEL